MRESERQREQSKENASMVVTKLCGASNKIFFFKILRNRKDTPHVKQAVGSECRCVRTRRKFVLENTDMRDKRAKEQE
jgi:hypothetical protein